MEYILILREYWDEYVFPRFLEMVNLPYENKEILWAIAPLIVTLFLVQIYFGRNRNEELGWNTAYANCIMLIFVAFNLANHVYNAYGYEKIISGIAWYKSAIVILVGLLGMNLLFIDFFHSISKRISFFLSDSLTITFLAYIAIIGVYSDVPLDRHTFVASLFFFIVLYVFFKLLRSVIPPSEEGLNYLREKQLEKQKKILEKKMKIEHEIAIIKEKIGGKLNGMGKRWKYFGRKPM